MKKVCTFAIVSVLAVGTACAGNMNNAKITTTTYVAPIVDAVVTVDQVPNMNDNQNVVMTGYLVETLGDNMYIFQDSTGTIAVEIEPVVMGEMVVMPDRRVRLKGEVDKGDNNQADVIEVDYITTM